MRRPTMRDVAARAGVSLKTVSRVVNSEPGVSPELVDAVREAARQLDYRHNFAARQLRMAGQRTHSVAVLVQDLSNPYSAELIRAIDDIARTQHLVLISASLDEEVDREREVVANLIKRRVDGLVLVPASSDQSYLETEIAAGLAVVLVDRPPRNLVVDNVTVENEEGARKAVTHLLHHGHRRIAIVTDDLRVATARARLHGYLRGLEDGGGEADSDLVRTARTAAAADRVVTELLHLPDPPTAMFTARNCLTEGAVAALQHAGLSHQVALVGFDDVPLADLLVPGVTVVRQDPLEIGRAATTLLLERLDDPSLPARDIVLPTELVVRGSGEIPYYPGVQAKPA